MFKKIISAFLITVTLLVSSPLPALAQGTWYSPTYGDFNNKVNDNNNPEEIFGERYTQAQVYWIVYSLINFLVGNGFLNCTSPALQKAADTSSLASALTDCANQSGITDPNQDQSLNTTPANLQSPVLALTKLADTVLKTKPASGVEYLSQTFRVIPEAQAQGFGYTSLAGAQNLWKASRNMAYALMILVFIVLAFGIMLRVKLSPQTVMSVQSALPKVAIGLVLITFSYAIAGLLIDFSYVIQGVFAVFFKATQQPGGQSLSNIPDAFAFMNQMNRPVDGMVAIGFLVLLFALIIGTGVGVVTGAAIPVIGIPLGAMGGIILALLLILVFIVGIVRLIWLFLKTYAALLLYIIFGPFFILMGAANLGSGVTGWIRNIAAHLSVFVVANVMVVMAHVIIWGSGAFPWLAGGIAANTFNTFGIATGQASLGSAQVPGFGTFSTETLGFFVGIVILLSIPNIASAAKEFVATGRVGKFTLGVGESFGPTKALGLFGAAEGLNKWEEAFRRGHGQTAPLPAPIQFARRVFGLKPR